MLYLFFFSFSYVSDSTSLGSPSYFHPGVLHTTPLLAALTGCHGDLECLHCPQKSAHGIYDVNVDVFALR
jgi:hypothetical protein